MTPEPARPWHLPALLAALAMLGPFSIDTYLPAFPACPVEGGRRTARALLKHHPGRGRCDTR